MNPIKKGLFIHKHPADVKVIVRDAVEDFGCSWLAYCIQDVKINSRGKQETQAMNRYNILNDKWLRELIDQSERKLAIFPYANILASDTTGEAKDIIKRISPFVNKPAFGGIMLRLKPMVAREGAQVERLIRLIRAAYPGMTIGSVHDSARYTDDVKALLTNTDYHMPIVHGKTTTLYQAFNSAYVWMMAYSKKPIYPIVSISDMPSVGYKVDIAKVKSFWLAEMADKTMAAVGVWNWYPEDPQVIRITMDGSDAAKLTQLLRWMKWTRNTTETPTEPPDPEIEPPVIVPVEPSATDKLNILWNDYLARKQAANG